ncbi:uncharacterized protein K444DRAFT_720870 [Hyaloscypha bicolor E]|uniref:Uncharacterized protein n=1 Tax=Hyaloscypha bicolor E TaxID=1095630 RepID=A0A2J6TC60_9HELO|nr:uncharacterized protein K444DRAFT_720870 [Hyaloscypha bicolor E]PMD60583.1 hypothetical protein K444DRAFT_720870 [Hyaloscypha bicolor E]
MQGRDDARQEDLTHHEERDSKRQIAYREEFENKEASGADESPETQRPYQNQNYQRALSDSQDTDDMEAEEREAVYPGYPSGSNTLSYSPDEGSFSSNELLSWFPSHDLTNSLHILHTLSSDGDETEMQNDDPRPLPPSNETTPYFLTPIYNPIDPTCKILQYAWNHTALRMTLASYCVVMSSVRNVLSAGFTSIALARYVQRRIMRW